MQDNFEEQFKASVKSSVAVENESSASRIDPGKKVRIAKLPLIVGLVAFVILVGIGAFLTVQNFIDADVRTHEEKIAELTPKLEELREKETEELKSTGFSESFYAALLESTPVADEVAEHEDAIYEVKSIYDSPMAYVTHNGAIYYFVFAVIALVVGIGLTVIIKGSLKRQAIATSVVIAMALGFVVVSNVIAEAQSVGTGATIEVKTSLNKISFEKFVREHSEYIDELTSRGLTYMDSNGDVKTIAEEAIGYDCSMRDVESYFVDFKDVSAEEIAAMTPAKTEVNTKGHKRDDDETDEQWDNFKAGLEVRTKEQLAAMIQNTLYLQLVEWCAPKHGVNALRIPKGEFYFAIGNGGHVIKPQDNVSIFGSGIGEFRSTIDKLVSNRNNYTTQDQFTQPIHEAIASVNGDNATILKDYTTEWYGRTAAPTFFNYGGVHEKDPNVAGDENSYDFLKNVHYSNFIIDGKASAGKEYNSSGKGFNFWLFEDVTWNYVVVLNTDGTAFGVDEPRGDSWIKNSLAYDGGKKALTPDRGGASGFGIGTGFTNNESFTIENSIAYGNTKFGFFFEHQNRFRQPNCLPGQVACTSENLPYTYHFDATVGNFNIRNCVSIANLYNYGGLRANDVKVTNSTSIGGSVSVNDGTYYAKTISTDLGVMFSDESRNIEVNNLTYINGMPSDITDTSAWYYDAVKWASMHSIAYGVNTNYFGVNEELRRGDAVIMLWRMMGFPGDTVTRANNNQAFTAKQLANGSMSAPVNTQYVRTCFSDVDYTNDYAPAILWASKYPASGPITVGTSGACRYDSSGNITSTATFSPNSTITRAEFVTMLWRLAGKPSTSQTANFSDVGEDKSEEYYYKAIQWADEKGIAKGFEDGTFRPENKVSRAQAVTFLYRYAKAYNIKQ